VYEPRHIRTALKAIDEPVELRDAPPILYGTRRARPEAAEQLGRLRLDRRDAPISQHRHQEARNFLVGGIGIRVHEVDGIAPSERRPVGAGHEAIEGSLQLGVRLSWSKDQ
jgi:hypothetical protein